MKVITLTPGLLRTEVRRLAETVASGGCRPDVIVGVRHGGYEVMRLLVQEWPAEVATGSVSASRPGHKVRKGGSSVLSHLPYKFTDMLRKAESWFLEHMSGRNNAERHVDCSQLTATCDIMLKRPGSCCLIVDDAVDSGHTLAAVVDELRCRYPNSVIMTAALTVTTGHPVMTPNFSLYKNVLIRFPWSSDTHMAHR